MAPDFPLARVILAREGLQDLAAAIERGQAFGTEQNFARIYDLVYHFEAAGAQREAFGFGLLAAEQSRRQFAPEVAAQQYATAKRNSAGASADLCVRFIGSAF